MGRLILCIGMLLVAGLPAYTQTASKPPAQSGQSATPVFKADSEKAKKSFNRGLKAEQASDWEAAYRAFSDAVNFAPGTGPYLMHREIAKNQLVQQKMDTAERDAVSGRLEDAFKELLAARKIDPTNSIVQERYAEMTALHTGQLEQAGPTEVEIEGPVVLEPTKGTRNFDIRGDTISIYDNIAKQFGLDDAFDVDLRPRQVHFKFSDVDFATAMRLAGEMTKTFWRPLTKRSFFVAEDNSQKRKDYGVSVVRTMLLSSSETQEQMTELSRIIRDITGITRTDLDSRSGTLTLRGSPQAVAVASALVDDLEQSSGEMVLEIEILEVDRNYARLLGLTPPETASILSISPQEIQEALTQPGGIVAVLQQIFGTPSSLSGLTPSQISNLLSSGNVGIGSLIPPLIAFGGGYTTFLATLPGATANFAEMLSLVHHGRRMLLRAEDGKPATFFVGERFPVTLAQFSPSFAGEGGSVPGVESANFPTTNFDTGNAPTFVVTPVLRASTISTNADMVVANNTDNTLSIFLGNGDGTFQNPTTVKTGVGPVWISTGNFNTNTAVAGSDQFLDLAVVNNGDNSVSIFLGNGDGTFKTPTTLTSTLNLPVSAAATNLTSSGFTDLVVANHGNNTLSVFLGNGDGTFKTPTTVATGRSPSCIAFADFNGDGKMDLAVTNDTDATVSVFLGNGDGTFATPTNYDVGNFPVWVSTGDFNGDTFPDIAVANNGAPTSTLTGNTVSILLNQVNTLGNPTGTFSTHVDFPAGNGPTSIAVADYNVDGRLDLAVADQTDNAVSILLGLGSGLFGPNFELPVETDPVSISTAEFDTTGKPEVAVANHGSNTVSVILNQSQFGVGTALPQTAFPGVQYIDIGTKVKATPRVHPNDEVTLQMNFELTSLGSVSFNGIPVVNQQSVTQTVRLREGETTAVAGILQPQYTHNVNGIPGLAELPGLGYLGATKNDQDQNTELLFLITPRMVSLAPRKDRAIFAGKALEGPGAFGPTRQERGVQPNAPQQPEQPEGQPGQPPPQAQPQPQPQTDAPPQTEPGLQRPPRP